MVKGLPLHSVVVQYSASSVATIILRAMAVSEALLKRVEESLQNADPSIFKKDSPFSLGMEEWFSDSDQDFQAPKTKKRKSLTLEKKPKEHRFELVSEKEADKSAKGVVPKNTEKNDRWALNAFNAWIKERNERCKELSPNQLCPEDVLDGDNAELLNKWLSLFVMEVRKGDGTRYPPSSIHLILCGLQRYMRRNNASPVNIFDKQDVHF